jgi:glycosyltransferase involved in cell wall biosynthesis
MKIAIVYNTTEYVWYRRFFIRELLDLGHEVVALAPGDEWDAKVEGIGVRHVRFALSRRGRHPLQELSTLWSLWRALRRERPDAVLLYTAKPVLYGSLTGWLAGCRRIFSTVAGLGHTFSGMTRPLMHGVYRLAMRCNERVFFQNDADLDYFVHHRLLPRDKSVLVAGSGVDTEHFAPHASPATEPCFLLVSRMLWEKGIGEYVEAARRIRDQRPEVRFCLLGPTDDHPTAIPRETIDRWVSEGVVEYLGYADDVRPHLRDCYAFVLPSYYREGIPRTALEALAMGKAIITTDMPGCRDTVQDGVNGLVVEPRDEAALAAAMMRLIDDPDTTRRMGEASRARALSKFSIESVHRAYLEALERGTP